MADGQYNSTVHTFRNGARVPLQVDVNGNLKTVASSDASVSRVTASAATNNATVAKSSEGVLLGVNGYNSNAAARYLKIYNKATAPTVGTDTPVLTIALAPTSMFNLTFPGIHFSAGISYALVTGNADSDNTAVGLGEILGLNVIYQ